MNNRLFCAKYLTPILFFYITTFTAVPLFLHDYAYAQKLQSEKTLSQAEKKYRQYCIKKEECKLYSELRTAFDGVSGNDSELITKIENCSKSLDKIRDNLSILLKKEKKVVPLDLCK